VTNGNRLVLKCLLGAAVYTAIVFALVAVIGSPRPWATLLIGAGYPVVGIAIALQEQRAAKRSEERERV
jgi:hypothetical protein